jgi:carboxypeptidase Q
MRARTFAVALLPLLVLIPVRAEERVDLDAIHKIKAEAFENSKVMDHLFYLTDVYGPRVTNSPGFFGAADWVVKQLEGWGINARLENWGPFGRGWTYSRFTAHLIKPQYAPLIGFPLAWSPGTNGVISGEPMLAPLAAEADLEKYKGKLKGRIVLTSAPRDLAMNVNPLGKRYTDAELAELALAPDPARTFGPRPPNPAGNFEQVRQFQKKLSQFLHDEEPLLVVRIGQGRSEGGTVFGQGGGSRDPKDPVSPPMVVLTPEHYNRIVRLLDHKILVKVEFEVEANLDDRTDSVNVVGEIPGGRKKDEVVMVGAHLDSWQGGTGATDNGAGSAVMIEVMRILKTLNFPLDRTVRIGLWGGEEEGLLGSRAYVKEHFGDRETMKLQPDHARLDAYFNVDNGTGKVRGVYLQGNDMMRPIFEAWFAPFRDLAPGTISIRNTGGTDHQSFDAVGLPGFQFIQDPIEYESRTHHSNMDVYDRIQKGDLMQTSAIVASFVYNAAMRDQMLPRKPLPKPPPRQGEGNQPGVTGAAQQ